MRIPALNVMIGKLNLDGLVELRLELATIYFHPWRDLPCV